MVSHLSEREAQRFDRMVDRFCPARGLLGPCWLWTGARARDGYGRFRLGAEHDYGMATASRLALEVSIRRDLGEGMRACHRCDNPPCVNPDHLFEGTVLDNERDKLDKGRTPRGRRHGRHTMPHRTARGSRGGRAKLTEEIVMSIRPLVRSGLSQAEVARRLGVTPTIVSRILSGKIWTHVTGE